LPHAEPETPQWFAQRREGITATDLPKILGLSKHGNALSVWLDKRGELPEEDAGEPAYWGGVLEEPIAQRYAALQGVQVRRVGVVHHAGAPWVRCSLDRLVFDAPWSETSPASSQRLLGAQECKNRNAFVAGAWSQDVPDDVLAQVQWQLMVTGLPWIDVAVLLGGNRLLVHRVKLEKQVAALCLTEATRVWQHVLDGTPPAVDPDATLLDLLTRLYPNREGIRELDADQADQARTWIAAREQAKAIEKQAKCEVEAAEAALVHLLDDAEHAQVGEDVLFSYARRDRGGYTVAPTSYRQLTFNRKA
jgi:putative phage-type endonuclease